MHMSGSPSCIHRATKSHLIVKPAISRITQYYIIFQAVVRVAMKLYSLLRTKEKNSRILKLFFFLFLHRMSRR